MLYSKASYPDSICVADTSFSTLNVGDKIIRESAYTHIQELFPENRILSIPTQTPLGFRGRSILHGSTPALVLGTNILGFESWIRRSWRMNFSDVLTSRQRFLAFGCGAFSYKAIDSKVGKVFLGHVLCNGPHSVRDERTAEYLAKVVDGEVYPTGCPTIWDMRQENVTSAWNEGKKAEVVFSVNSNKQSSTDISNIIKLLKQEYEKIHIWRQRAVDVVELSPAEERIVFIPPRLSALDDCLFGRDYIGARLHAGVRALNLGCRACILAVDNRATEMGLSSGLPVINVGDDVLKQILCFCKNDSPPPLINLRLQEVSSYKKELRKFLAI